MKRAFRSFLRSLVLWTALCSLALAAWGEPAPVFVTRWGGYGFADGQFREITDLTVGPDHNVYVADGLGPVSVFSPDGAFLRHVNLGGASHIAVDDAGIAVAAAGNGVFPWGWLAAGGITALALLPNGNILLGFEDNPVPLREYSRAGLVLHEWATSGPGQICCIVADIVRIPGGDLVVYDGLGRRFSTDGDYIGPINVGPYAPYAASTTRLFCATASDREMHVLTLDGQHVAQFGAGVIGIPRAAAVDGDTIYVADSFGQYIEKFSYGPVAIAPSTWSRVKAAYK